MLIPEIWPEKLAAVLHMTFSIHMKIDIFWFILHETCSWWSKLTISQHWVRYWQATSHYVNLCWANLLIQHTCITRLRLCRRLIQIITGILIGQQIITGLILGQCPANERRRYFVTTSLIGPAQAYNQPCSYVGAAMVMTLLLDACIFQQVKKLNPSGNGPHKTGLKLRHHRDWNCHSIWKRLIINRQSDNHVICYLFYL